jgi:hypothetical protein
MFNDFIYHNSRVNNLKFSFLYYLKLFLSCLILFEGYRNEKDYILYGLGEKFIWMGNSWVIWLLWF